MAARRLSEQFEDLVARIFEAQRLTVDRAPAGADRGVDLIIGGDDSQAAVEIKLWRSSGISTSEILLMCQQVDLVRSQLQIPFGIVAISAVLNPGRKSEANAAFPKIRVYDLNTLSFLAAANEPLATEFSAFVNEALAFSREINLSPEPPPEGGIQQARPIVPPPLEIPHGGQLCQALRDVPPGRKNARRFEQACVAALRHVFENDLTGWQEQHRTESGISVYDTVCRVVPRHDLWTMIVDQFNSRYVIFEFKNYGARIKQGQIYTTEKYLYRPALRAVALIISRKGADKHAIAASNGALREHGKLIINLTIDDICDMLHEKDQRNDPNSILMSKLDEMLMRIER